MLQELIPAKRNRLNCWMFGWWALTMHVLCGAGTQGLGGGHAEAFTLLAHTVTSPTSGGEGSQPNLRIHLARHLHRRALAATS